jgi:hypothetical protein
MKSQADSSTVMQKLDSLQSHITSSPHDIHRKLDALESRMKSQTDSSAIFNKLSTLETHITSSPQEVLKKLAALESRMAEPSQEVFHKLAALESHVDPSDVMAKLNELHRRLSPEAGTNFDASIKDSVHAKLDELEKRVGGATSPLAVTADMWTAEMRRLGKLNHMRTKLVNA